MFKKKPRGGLKAAATKMRVTMGKKAFRIGTYTAGTTAVVVALLVVINLCVSALPTKYTSFDMTDDSLYSISEQTEKILKALDEPVKVYWIVQEGAEDETVQLLLANYKDLSKNFTYEKIDPVVNPNFAGQYTSEGVYDNSLIVSNSDESKTRYISYYDIFSSSYDENYNETVEYNGEGALTSAVNYVSTDAQTQTYYLSGHGEDSIPSGLASSLTNENLLLSELNLLSEDGVPEDCETLIIYSPARDISAKEITKIEKYLEDGGNLLLFTDCDAEDLTNLYGLMAKYGMEPVEGMVVEGNSNYFMGNYPNYLLPEIESHEITDPISEGNYYVLLPVAQGLRISSDDGYETSAAADSDADGSSSASDSSSSASDGTDTSEESAADSDAAADSEITTTALLRTTDEAYSKLSGIKATNAEKETGDIDAGADGFALAAAAESSANGSKVVWIGSTTIADESVDAAVSGANTDFVLNAVGWMCEIEESVSIHAKTVTSEYLSLTSAQSSRWTTIMVGVIPIGFVAAGIYVWARRRKIHG